MTPKQKALEDLIKTFSKLGEGMQDFRESLNKAISTLEKLSKNKQKTKI